MGLISILLVLMVVGFALAVWAIVHLVRHPK